MRRVGVTLFVGAVLLASSIARATIQYYVSTTGSDANPGTAASPFLTPARARDAIRQLKAANGNTLPDDVEVVFAAGVYYLPESFVLEAQDSAGPVRRITYRAAEEGMVTFHGGTRLGGWTPVAFAPWQGQALGGQVWKRPTVGFQFRDLYYNNRRLKRARHPDSGWAAIARTGYWYPTACGTDYKNRQYSADIWLPGGNHQGRATEAVARHKWVSPRQIVYSTWAGAPGTNVFTAYFTEAAPLGIIGPEPWLLVKGYGPDCPFECLDGEPGSGYTYDGDSMYLENAYQFLNAQDEWYRVTSFDVAQNPSLTAGDIYVVLPAGADPNNGVTVAPRLTRLVDCYDVQNISFVGLNFAFTNFPLPTGGYITGQAGHARGYGGPLPCDSPFMQGRFFLEGAVRLTRVDGCEVLNCRVAHTGGSGVQVFGDSTLLQGNEIFDIGGTGIYIGDYDYSVCGTLPVRSADVSVVSNYIYDFGVTYKDNVGIFSLATDRLSVVMNEVAHGPHSGMSIGYGFTRNTSAPLASYSTYVAFNEVHDVLRDLTEGSGIYLNGTHGCPTSGVCSVLADNYVHSISRPSGYPEGWISGFSFDDGSWGWQLLNNAVEVDGTYGADLAGPMTFNCAAGGGDHTRPFSLSDFVWGTNYSTSAVKGHSPTCNPCDSSLGCPPNWVPIPGQVVYSAAARPLAVQSIINNAGLVHGAGYAYDSYSFHVHPLP